MSEKIKSHHLSRKAVLYIRQSSSFQVTHYQESRRLQYGMKNRLREFGWQNIEIVDEDLGRSASSAGNRTGFERMVAEVCMGKIGAVAAREVSRFARNSREWQQLIEVCRVVDTVLIDHDSIYDPRRSNDRLLLGLKGSLNEYELDLLRLRSLEARQEKAKRGELIVSVPVGYIKTKKNIEKTPDKRVQQAITAVFQKFLELGSVRQVLYWFINNDLTLPSLHVEEDETRIEWKRPRYSTVNYILTNPCYAGIYAFGRTQISQEFVDGILRKTPHRKAASDWHVLLPDHHDGYIDKQQYERIQAMITANSFNETSEVTGAAKRGPALLSGLLRCRRCGQKLLISYTGRKRTVVRYVCFRGYLDTAEPKCISFGGDPVDVAVSRELLRVVEPAAIDAALQTYENCSGHQNKVIETLQLEFEEAKYAVDRAWRQYNNSDPENRLVTSELEKRWNHALERVGLLQQKIQEQQNTNNSATVTDKNVVLSLATKLPEIWNHPETDVTLKKRILRALIEDILVDVDTGNGFVNVIIHWKGGVHTELQVRRRKRGQNKLHTCDDVVNAVKQLALICPDDKIAHYLSRNGFLTGRGYRWTQEGVASVRNHRGIIRYSSLSREVHGWMNLTEAACYLGILQRSLRQAVESGKISALHPLPDGPWIFKREDLDLPEVQKTVEAIRNRRKGPRNQYAENVTLFNSSTYPGEVV